MNGSFTCETIGHVILPVFFCFYASVLFNVLE